MIKYRFLLLVLGLCGLFAQAVGGSPKLSPNIANPNAYFLGQHYQAIEPPPPTQSPGQIEVIEAFSFACPHCYEFEPLIAAWRARQGQDVQVRRLPVVFGRSTWKSLAKAYFVAESLGVVDKIAGPLFQAIHAEKRRLTDESSLKTFFSEQGVRPEDFVQAYGSKSVEDSVQKAEQLLAKFGVTGVPTLIVNGKYQTSTSLTGDYETLLKVVDHLVARERMAQNP